MIKSYGIPGESQETRTELDQSVPYVLMSSDRPAPHYVCQVVDGVGVWVESPRAYPEMSSLDFLRLFDPERRAIKQAAIENIDIGIWYDDTVAAQFVTYSDPRVEVGLSALVDAGLLTEARKVDIITAMTHV